MRFGNLDQEATTLRGIPIRIPIPYDSDLGFLSHKRIFSVNEHFHLITYYKGLFALYRNLLFLQQTTYVPQHFIIKREELSTQSDVIYCMSLSLNSIETFSLSLLKTVTS